MTGRLVAGMDLGSTGMKLLVRTEDGAELVVEEVPTPWRAGPGGTADLPPTAGRRRRASCSVSHPGSSRR